MRIATRMKGETGQMVVRIAWRSGSGLEMKAQTKSMEGKLEMLSEVS